MVEERIPDDSINSVLLVISQGDHNAGSAKEVDAGSLGSEEWESLIAESYGLSEVRIRVDRDLLSKKSTYFMGYRNFREAECGTVNVDWNLPIFCTLLDCIHGCGPRLSSYTIAPLIQGAIYFGVEEAIEECKEWADSTMCKVSWGAEDDFLSHLLSIWHSATDNGVNSIRELCVKGLAINFAMAVLRDNFVALPFLLLAAFVDHPELTVQSERHLCDALFIWYENQEEGSPHEPHTEDPASLFKKIQLSLLPIEYLLRRLVGKYPLSMFKSISTSREFDSNVLDSIFGSRGVLPWKPVRHLMRLEPVIRITEHLEELDLSGCQQITCHLLFWSAAQTSIVPKYKVRRAPFTTEQEAWPDIPRLDRLKKLNLSQCWRIEQSALLLWLEITCPNLTELIVSNCPQLQVKTMLSLRSPHLSILDMSEPEELVEIEGAITRKKSAILDRSPLLWDDIKLQFRNSWMELSLRGRSEITDVALLCIARNCPSLVAVDLSGCAELSDLGIAAFLKSYTHGFKKVCAAGTEFGPACCRALIWPSISDSLGHPTGLASGPVVLENHILDTLDLEKCSVLVTEDLQSLLQALPSLVSLSLAFTRLNDSALSAFCGTNLQHLNLRETKVSRGVVAQILARNPGLKDLTMRGCTQMALHTLDHLSLGKVHAWENVEAGWGFSDPTARSLGFGSCSSLQSFTVGIGGTTSSATLLLISEQCPKLKRLSLCFQVISDDALTRVLRNLKHLHTLELQNSTQISHNLLRVLSPSSAPHLRRLRLERVTPWLVDDDISHLSQSCTGLQSLSLLGCHALTSNSLTTITNRWRSLQDLRLEDCHNILTRHNAMLLLTMCQALQVLHLRHIGKSLLQNFIVEAGTRLPMLQKLAIDLCDSVDDGYSIPVRMERNALKVVHISQCRSDKHTFRSVIASSTEASNHYGGRFHKDTKVLEWNSVRLKESVISERLTFD